MWPVNLQNMNMKSINNQQKSFMKQVIIFILLLTGSLRVFGQQDPMYNQYIFNSFTINSAEAGTRNIGTVSFLHRWQWLGIKGSPATSSFGIETPIGHKGWGAGINVVSDRLGPEQNQTFNIAGSYQVRLTDTYRLSAGLSFVGNMRRASLDDLRNLYDVDDPDMAQINTFNPNVGGGLLLYSSKNFLGISLPRFREYKLTEMDMLPLNQLRHLFVYGGHIFAVNENLWFKPSVLFKFVNGAPTEIDLNAVVHLRKIVDVGVNYRTGDGIGLLAGLKLRDQFILNYVYEFPLTDIRFGSLKTHEIGVRYLFGKGPDHSVDSPRFFN